MGYESSMNDADWLRKRLNRRDGGCLLLLVLPVAAVGAAWALWS